MSKPPAVRDCAKCVHAGPPVEPHGMRACGKHGWWTVGKVVNCVAFRRVRD